jgi:hypothetical protein
VRIIDRQRPTNVVRWAYRQEARVGYGAHRGHEHFDHTSQGRAVGKLAQLVGDHPVSVRSQWISGRTVITSANWLALNVAWRMKTCQGSTVFS